MTETKIFVDASAGTEVNVGDVVAQGRQLGMDPDGAPVRCPADGEVRKVSFEGDCHRFSITIGPIGSSRRKR